MKYITAIQCLKVRVANATRTILHTLPVLLITSTPATAVGIRSGAIPGELINVGEHRLHIYCRGQGSPAIIIDAGLGGFSLEWMHIQESLSPYVRVCSYDRAGYGWSEAGPQPRTTEQISGELHRLLSNADIPPPYILVGHSFGGYNVRHYTAMHPEQVSGMVLIDASHPDQVKRLPRPVKTTPRETEKRWSVRLTMPVIPENYPADARQLAYMLMAKRQAIYTRDREWADFSTSAEQVRRYGRLPDIPLTVITRGRRVWPDNQFGNESEKVWFELQSDLTGLSHKAVQVIATNSGHLVHLDEPDLVIRNIKNTVIKAASGKRYTMLAGLSPQSQFTLRMSNAIALQNLPTYIYGLSANTANPSYIIPFPY